MTGDRDTINAGDVEALLNGGIVNLGGSELVVRCDELDEWSHDWNTPSVINHSAEGVVLIRRTCERCETVQEKEVYADELFEQTDE